MDRRAVLKTIGGAATALAAPGVALSQTRPIKIGELTDYTGIYRDAQGPGEEFSIRAAIQDFNGGKVLGRPVELLVGDNLNKADVSSDIAKRWLDVEKVDMMVCSGSSVAGLAAHVLARDRGIITVIPAGTAINFTEQDCSPLGFHWIVDSYAGARSAVLASGDNAKKKWFFISLDNVVGQTGYAVCSAAIQEAGGQVVGQVKHPLNTTDFASFIAQAQASRADVVVFHSAGTDLIRALTQAREFGLQAAGKVIVCPLLTFNDIVAAGQEVTQGLRFAEGFYWNMNEATRAFAKRFQEKMGRPPAASHGNTYAAITHYLQAIEAAKTTEGKAVAAQMKKMPISTRFWGNTAPTIRPNGRVVYDLNVMRIKSPAQSTGKFDVAEVIGAIPGDKVFKPLSQTLCKVA